MTAHPPVPGLDTHDLLALPAPLPPREILAAAGDILRALAAPVRIGIVLQLRVSERCVHAVSYTHLTLPTIYSV